MVRLKRQVMSFSIVGVVNTVIDFALLNMLNIVFGVPRIPANVVSTTTAMIFSFFANKRVVFGSTLKGHKREIILFFLVTIFGLYVLQLGIIYLLTEPSDAPGDFLYSIVELLRLDGVFSREFVVTNGTKVLATVVSMVWNYVMYRDVVFAHTKPAPARTDKESDQ